MGVLPGTRSPRPRSKRERGEERNRMIPALAWRAAPLPPRLLMESGFPGAPRSSRGWQEATSVLALPQTHSEPSGWQRGALPSPPQSAPNQRSHARSEGYGKAPSAGNSLHCPVGTSPSQSCSDVFRAASIPPPSAAQSRAFCGLDLRETQKSSVRQVRINRPLKREIEQEIEEAASPSGAL